MALTNGQQAVLMFAAFGLVPVGAWFGIGAPTDHASLALLGSGLVAGIIAFLKEYMGAVPTAAPPQLYIKNPDGTYAPEPSS